MDTKLVLRVNDESDWEAIIVYNSTTNLYELRSSTYLISDIFDIPDEVSFEDEKLETVFDQLTIQWIDCDRCSNGEPYTFTCYGDSAYEFIVSKFKCVSNKRKSDHKEDEYPHFTPVYDVCVTNRDSAFDYLLDEGSEEVTR